jgi:HEAT repeat protein
VTPLTNALKDSDIEVRRYAAFALGKLGSHARDALPALNAAFLKADDPQLRINIHDAIAKINEEPLGS